MTHASTLLASKDSIPIDDASEKLKLISVFQAVLAVIKVHEVILELVVVLFELHEVILAICRARNRFNDQRSPLEAHKLSLLFLWHHADQKRLHNHLIFDQIANIE